MTPHLVARLTSKTMTTMKGSTQHLQAGVEDGSIPSAVANTAAISSVRTTKDKNKHALYQQEDNPTRPSTCPTIQ